MLQIQLEVCNDEYIGLKELLSLFTKTYKYDSSEYIYYFDSEDYLFYSMLFAIHKHVNNKDNWVGIGYWDNIQLIVNFKTAESVYIRVYDNYVE